MRKHYHVSEGFLGCYPENNVAFASKDDALAYLHDVLAYWDDVQETMICVCNEDEHKVYEMLGSSYRVSLYACDDDGDICKEAFEDLDESERHKALLEHKTELPIHGAFVVDFFVDYLQDKFKDIKPCHIWLDNDTFVCARYSDIADIIVKHNVDKVEVDIRPQANVDDETFLDLMDKLWPYVKDY